jgi:transcription initiation factor IIE alpha subunit
MSVNYDELDEEISALLSEDVSEVYRYIEDKEGVSREEIYSSVNYSSEKVNDALNHLLEEDIIFNFTRVEPEEETYTVFKTFENL